MLADKTVVTKEDLGGCIRVKVMGRVVKQTNKVDEFPVYGKWKEYARDVLGAKGDFVV